MNCPGCVQTHRVVEDEGARRLAVNGDEHDERTLQACLPACPLGPSGGAANARPRSRANGDGLAIDDATDSPPGHLFDFMREDQVAVLAESALHDRICQHVGGHLVERPGHRQDSLWLELACGDDGGEDRAATGEGARLVDKQRRATAKFL